MYKYATICAGSPLEDDVLAGNINVTLAYVPEHCYDTPEAAQDADVRYWKESEHKPAIRKTIVMLDASRQNPPNEFGGIEMRIVRPVSSFNLPEK